MNTEASAPAAPTEVTGTALLTLDPEKYVAAVFASFRDQLETAKTAAAAVVIDVSTTTGMKVAVQHRATLRTIRVDAEKARKARKAPILEIGRLLDTRYRELEAEVEPLEARFDAAIKAEEQRKETERIAREQAEAQRIAHIQAGIRDIRGALIDVAGRGAAAIEEKIRELVALEITAENCAEFQDEAESVREQTLGKLRDMHAKAVEQEAAAAQLAADREALDRQREAQEAEQKRRDDEDAERARKAEAQQMAMSEISGIQQQVIIAQMGRAGVRRGGTIACIEETLAETEAWPIDRQRFGEFTGTATEVKDSVVAAIRALLTTARAQEAEAKRVKEAQDKLDFDRRVLEEQQHQGRLAEERRQHDEAIARETREREEREARELAARQERETAEGENRAVDEIARVERDTREAQQRELARINAEKLDIREALNMLRKRAVGLDEFAWFVTAFDRNSMPKQARRKAAATA